MNVTINPSPLNGEIAAVPSKSDAHRKLICGALSDSPCVIELNSLSKDIEATINCLYALGADIRRQGDAISIRPISSVTGGMLDCGESGSTLRFLLPVAAALGSKAAFTGHGRLPARSISQLVTAMEKHGVSFSSGELPFEITGRLLPGSYELPGDVSSQYISGLLLALPLLDKESRLTLSSPLESRGYVDMTLSALKAFGVETQLQENSYLIPSPQHFKSPEKVDVEGDWSSAAFFLCAGAVSGAVSLSGLDINSRQGDKAVLEILRQMGADVKSGSNSVQVSKAPLKGISIDVREIPDLLPILAVTAACAQGETRFTGASRLRDKESDRLSATASVLTALGGSVTELPDGLLVRGGSLTGGIVNGYNDHRMVMAAAIAATVCNSPVKILGTEAVSKSYPSFFEHYGALGGILVENNSPIISKEGVKNGA